MNLPCRTLFSSFPALVARRAIGRTQLVSKLGRRDFLFATRFLQEAKIIKVPTMGDSITEGTIVEWTAQVGEVVKADDVVALIETDKVTLEIKAEFDGVITKHFGAVDGSVSVGADLYEINTEARPTVEGLSGPPEDAATRSAATVLPENIEVATKAASSPTAEPQSSAQRVPSIRFLGKDGWSKLKSEEKNEPVLSTPVDPLQVTTIDVDTVIHPMYGRPVFTEDEMEALVFGGANVAPQFRTL